MIKKMISIADGGMSNLSRSPVPREVTRMSKESHLVEKESCSRPRKAPRRKKMMRIQYKGQYGKGKPWTYMIALCAAVSLLVDLVVHVLVDVVSIALLW